MKLSEKLKEEMMDLCTKHKAHPDKVNQKIDELDINIDDIDDYLNKQIEIDKNTLVMLDENITNNDKLQTIFETTIASLIFYQAKLK